MAVKILQNSLTTTTTEILRPRDFPTNSPAGTIKTINCLFVQFGRRRNEFGNNTVKRNVIFNVKKSVRLVLEMSASAFFYSEKLQFITSELIEFRSTFSIIIITGRAQDRCRFLLALVRYAAAATGFSRVFIRIHLFVLTLFGRGRFHRRILGIRPSPTKCVEGGEARTEFPLILCAVVGVMASFSKRGLTTVLENRWSDAEEKLR